MPTKFSQSVNLVRDEGEDFGYIVTPNAERVALEIFDGELKGLHSFQLIGSYGTGKSAFLLALTNTLRGKAQHFPLSRKEKVPEILTLIGEYRSFSDFLAENLGVKNDLAGNQRILDALHQQYEKKGRLYLFVDEFGKFLEYAAKHDPEKEMTFIQQLAEFVNKPGRKITLVVTLHQSFEGYSSPTQRQEWRKVQGRFKELTFNEPIAQLIHLAAQQLKRSEATLPKGMDMPLFAKLAKKHKLFEDHKETWSDEELIKLYPLDIISTLALTKGLQGYGQNERSLFSFLHSTRITPRKGAKTFGLPMVFDHLNSEFYSFLRGPYNPHRRQWEMIWSALDRIEAEFEQDRVLYSDLVKTIGLLQLFGSKAALVDEAFLSGYLAAFSPAHDRVEKRVQELIGKRILLFVKYLQSFKLQEGTDLDFDTALLRASAQVDDIGDVVPKLKPYFKHSFVTAKEVTYLTGAPRIFAYRLSNEPIQEVPKEHIDGFINLIFNEGLSVEQVIKVSKRTKEAILYGYFRDAGKIKTTLLDIQRTKHVIDANSEDRVAVKELKNILQHQEQLLDHYIHESLYSESVQWIHSGKLQKGVTNPRHFNKLLSRVIQNAYPATPEFLNELINREKVSASASTARKILFDRLTERWNEPQLGFLENEFPAERAIYETLLVKNQIHREGENGWDLFAPTEGSFVEVWQACDEFLKESESGRKDVLDLIEKLSQRPFKLKYGLIEILVPLYLYVRRGDFALYQDDAFVPHMNASVLYLMNRRPRGFQVKAFDVKGIRLKLFNKYKAFLGKAEVSNLSNGDLLEVVRPFLSFYRNLSEFVRNTEKLSQEAKALREAIKNATDPERTFFEDLPGALHLSLEEVHDSDEQLGHFIGFLSSAIDELQQAYPRLIDRVDAFLGDEVLGDGQRFPNTRMALAQRMKGIKEHQLLEHLAPLYKRTQVPLDTAEAFIDSITQGVMGKPLQRISDREEEILKERLQKLYGELDNLSVIHAEEDEHGNEPVVRVQITSSAHGMRTETIRYPLKQKAKIQKLAKELSAKLDKEPELATAVLAWLVNEKLTSHE